MARHSTGRRVALGPDLAAFARANRDVRTLSVYVAGGMQDPADRNHWLVVLKRGIAECRRSIPARSRADRDAFEAAVASVMELLPGDSVVHAIPGWAAFATEWGDMFVKPLDKRPEPSVSWQAGPCLVPSVAAATPSPAIVAVVDRKQASLYRMEHGALELLERLDADMDFEPVAHMGSAPRRGFHTGTRGSTQRDAAARKLRDSRERHVAHVASRIGALAGPESPVVMGGVGVTVSAIERALPESLRRHSIRASRLRAADAPARVASAAENALRVLDASRQADQAAALLDGASGTGHAAAGVRDVIAALERSAVDSIIVTPSLIARLPDAIEQVIREALAVGATVEVAHPEAARLIDAGGEGIVARLRYVVPTTRRARPRRTRTRGSAARPA